MTHTAIAPDLAGRRAAASAHPAAVPSGEARYQPFRATLRAATVTRDGKDFVQLDGYASTVEQMYEMWDLFGPYNEVVDARAFDATLAATPDVAFLVNHGGLTMARTAAGTLELSVDATGLHSRAFLNPKRQDVTDLVLAIEDGSVTEMSFAFTIEDGAWSPDYTEYRIKRVNLHRGDVSAVNYGANPNTSIAARAKQMFDAIETLEGPALRAAYERLSARLGVTPATPAATPSNDTERPSSGLGVDLLRARLEVEDVARTPLDSGDATHN